MLKKTAFGLIAFALLFSSSNVLLAQEASQFTRVDKGQPEALPLPEGTKLDLRNQADLTDEEKADKSATQCAACTGLNLTGTCYLINVGTYINANQQVPPQAGFRSFVTGGSNTLVSTCNDLSTTAPCQGFQFPSTIFGNNNAYNSNVLVLQSVGCLP